LRFHITPWASFIPVTAKQYNGYLGISTHHWPIHKTNNLRQTPYDCGAYNLHWIISTPTDLQDLVKMNRSKMIPRIGVVPETLQSTLKSQGIKSHIRTFRWLEDGAKISFLTDILNANHPIILLVRRHGYMHYITITGFDRNGFDIYDPLLPNADQGKTVDNNADKNTTIDKNGATPGNDYLTNKELLDLWNEINVWGFYKNTALIIHN
jgi:hypothetical protein